MLHDIGVGFFVGAGIPKGERVNTFAECGCCGAYHRTDFNGDCREDSERHWDLPDDAEVIYLEDDDEEDDGTACKCGRKFTADDIDGGRCYGCGTMITALMDY